MKSIPHSKARPFSFASLFHFGEGSSLWEPLTHLRSWNTFLWLAIVFGAGLWLLVWQMPQN